MRCVERPDHRSSSQTTWFMGMYSSTGCRDKWKGYPEDETGITWEPYVKIKENEKVDAYVLTHKLPRIRERN